MYEDTGSTNTFMGSGGRVSHDAIGESETGELMGQSCRGHGKVWH